MAKSAAFGVLHVVIAFTVGYALTGSWAVAGALTLVEPLANTVAHYFFDRWWNRFAARRAERQAKRWPAGARTPGETRALQGAAS